MTTARHQRPLEDTRECWYVPKNMFPSCNQLKRTFFFHEWKHPGSLLTYSCEVAGLSYKVCHHVFPMNGVSFVKSPCMCLSPCKCLYTYAKSNNETTMGKFSNYESFAWLWHTPSLSFCSYIIMHSWCLYNCWIGEWIGTVELWTMGCSIEFF